MILTLTGYVGLTLVLKMKDFPKLESIHRTFIFNLQHEVQIVLMSFLG